MVTNTNSDLRSLIGGTAVIFLGIAVGRIMGLISQIWIISSLSPDAFGTITFAFTACLILGNTVSLGIPEGITRLLSAGTNDSEDSLVSNATILAVGSGLVGGLFVYLLSQYPPNDLSSEMVVIGFFIPFIILYPVSKVYVGVLRGMEETKEATFAQDIFPKLVSIAIFAISLLIFHRPYLGAILYWLSTPFSVLIGTAVNYRPRLSVPAKKPIKNLISFSWPLALESSFVIFMTSVDIILIGKYLTPGKVGIYRSAQPLALASVFLLEAAVFLYLPMATRRISSDETAFVPLFRFISKWVSVLSMPYFALIILFPHSILEILYPDAYQTAANILSILGIGMFVRVVVGPTGATLKAAGSTRTELTAALGGLVMNISLNVLLLPRLGLSGAAIATGAGFALFNLIEIAVIRSQMDTPLYSLDLIKPVSLSWLLFFVLRKLVPHREGMLIWLVVIAPVIVVISLVVTGSISGQDKAIYRSIWTKYVK